MTALIVHPDDAQNASWDLHPAIVLRWDGSVVGEDGAKRRPQPATLI